MVSWAPPTSCVGYGGELLSYVIQYRVEGESIFTGSEFTASSDTLQHRVMDLTPATTYHLRVAARNAQGVGTPSDVVMATTHSVSGTYTSWKYNF